ncbi:hypothetical protein BB559_005668 [Furculomyces boomerangus]|uniref:Roadblock/LAMTOR2 domain-containing protein n=2 Tax=Harpellales TaxID=61421 RepID=A0A2T9Y790_9FUNG|nr:hypothetical protein BB559_005668 [Furculomyces boomerangus]PVZ97563.1 hypothetical protein BB558_006473 [Smittium angustum]
MNNKNGLMLIVITLHGKDILFRNVNQGLDEQKLEQELINQTIKTFDNMEKLGLSTDSVISAMYGGMQIVQFKSGNYYGTMVADSFSNSGQLLELSKSISKALKDLEIDE